MIHPRAGILALCLTLAGADGHAQESRIAGIGVAAASHLAGERFNRALLRIWLGDEPIEEDLKRALLGLEARTL